MNLYHKITSLYPELKPVDFSPLVGTINIQNDGGGDYIAKWEHSLPKPTEEQLKD